MTHCLVGQYLYLLHFESFNLNQSYKTVNSFSNLVSFCVFTFAFSVLFLMKSTLRYIAQLWCLNKSLHDLTLYHCSKDSLRYVNICFVLLLLLVQFFNVFMYILYPLERSHLSMNILNSLGKQNALSSVGQIKA